MRLACYSPDNIGHYGLSLEHYCHFTSPIRRYVDTIIHRLLFEKGPIREEIDEICDQASEKERASARAEGTLIGIKKLRLLNAWHKKSPHRVYKAIITRVKPFGISFDVSELMQDGFLHVSQLEDDYYVFDEDASQLVGRYEGITYSCGQKISVRCVRADLLLQEATWEICE
jgi:ribonuclease R